MFFSVQGGTKSLHEGQILSHLRFQFRNRDATLHMFGGVTIARLEAELAEFKGFMERYRSSLQREEQES